MAVDARRNGSRRSGLSERHLAAAMLSPSLAVIALVAAYPIGYATWLSLNEYSVRVPGLSRFAALRNYTTALSSDDFWNALTTTLLYSVLSVGFAFLIGLGMALTMNEAFRGRSAARTIVLVPWAVLTVVTAISWRSMFDPNLGFVNPVLRALGLPGADVVWLGTDGYALAVIIIHDVWKTAPFIAVLLLAGLQGIPQDLYEAAKVDGASAWQRLGSITLPLLKPAILVALIFRTLDALRVFDVPYVLTGGASGTNTLSLYAYQQLTVNLQIGLGSALSVLTFIIVMGVSLAYIRLVGGNLRALAEER